MTDVRIPGEGSIWKHKNGGVYQVVMIANATTEKPDEYPITVVYKRISDRTIWSRPLSRWHGSMQSSWLDEKGRS
jgi:hypothetical protein